MKLSFFALIVGIIATGPAQALEIHQMEKVKTWKEAAARCDNLAQENEAPRGKTAGYPRHYGV